MVNDVAVEVFSNPQFDVKQWINEQLAVPSKDTTTKAEELDERLSKLLSQVQATMQGIMGQLDLQSYKLADAVPHEIGEIRGIHKETISLRSSMSKLLEEVGEADEKNHMAVDFLSQIDEVKCRLERCQRTLLQVTNWEQTISRVERAFESRDLQKIAVDVHNMQSSLQALRDLPNFEKKSIQVAGMRDRLEVMTTPHLLETLSTGPFDFPSQLHPPPPLASHSSSDPSLPVAVATLPKALTVLERSALSEKATALLIPYVTIYERLNRISTLQALFVQSRRECMQRLGHSYLHAKTSAAPAATTADGASIQEVGESLRKQESGRGADRLKQLPLWLPHLLAQFAEFFLFEMEFGAQMFPGSVGGENNNPTNANSNSNQNFCNKNTGNENTSPLAMASSAALAVVDSTAAGIAVSPIVTGGGAAVGLQGSDFPLYSCGALLTELHAWLQQWIAAYSKNHNCKTHDIISLCLLPFLQRMHRIFNGQGDTPMANSKQSSTRATGGRGGTAFRGFPWAFQVQFYTRFSLLLAALVTPSAICSLEREVLLKNTASLFPSSSSATATSSELLSFAKNGLATVKQNCLDLMGRWLAARGGYPVAPVVVLLDEIWRHFLTGFETAVRKLLTNTTNGQEKKGKTGRVAGLVKAKPAGSKAEIVVAPAQMEAPAAASTALFGDDEKIGGSDAASSSSQEEGSDKKSGAQLQSQLDPVFQLLSFADSLRNAISQFEGLVFAQWSSAVEQSLLKGLCGAEGRLYPFSAFSRGSVPVLFRSLLFSTATPFSSSSAASSATAVGTLYSPVSTSSTAAVDWKGNGAQQITMSSLHRLFMVSSQLEGIPPFASFTPPAASSITTTTNTTTSSNTSMEERDGVESLLNEGATLLFDASALFAREKDEENNSGGGLHGMCDGNGADDDRLLPSSQATLSTSTTSGVVGTSSARKLLSHSVLCLAQSRVVALQLVPACQEVIFDILFAAVVDKFQGFAEWPVWSAKLSAKQARLNLPAFSTNPSDYIVEVGEHLLSLVGHLEAFMVHAQEEEDERINAGARGEDNESREMEFWVTKVAYGVIASFITNIQDVPRLSLKGCQQLAADIEYFANIMHSLDLPLPPMAKLILKVLLMPEKDVELIDYSDVEVDGPSPSKRSPSSSSSSSFLSSSFSSSTTTSRQQARTIVQRILSVRDPLMSPSSSAGPAE